METILSSPSRVPTPEENLLGNKKSMDSYIKISLETHNLNSVGQAWVRKFFFFGKRIFFGLKHFFGQKKIFGQKKFFGQNKFLLVKKNCQKKFWSKKICGRKKFVVKKILVKIKLFWSKKI